MIETRRTGSALTGRPLRDKVIGQTRQLASIVEGLAPDRRDEAHDKTDASELDTEVSSSLETIQKVTETYGVLLDKLSAYELKVRDLTRKLSEEARTTGDALRAAARAEQIAREAQAQAARAQTKAAAAEAEAERAGDNVRALEHQLGALRAQTSKLMNAVDQLFPDLDESPTSLRVVR